ncbi:hypothetical protein DYB37_008551 [Aphanomyces astaci]|uniref:Uncharacterized protein n=1 Tax=Aphanomyces astaci TaxID=112090 RepID=A0A3R6Y511_APHAT|nr:hypothetical protein DYB37_008551 [Aphanomyces astaci]
MSVAYGIEVEATEIPAAMDPVHRINDALRSMIMTQVQTVLFTTHLDADIKVCDATKSDWNWFVNTEYQELISRAMMWRDGAIYIVELPGGIHEDMRQRIEADECFGSAPSIGAVIPANLAWNEFHTLKIEVGISRGWRYLDPNAIR